MAGDTLDLIAVLSPTQKAGEIAAKFDTWTSRMRPWINEKLELRNYIYATDTTTTDEATLPFKNSTAVPKLTQIADNLHANYMMSMFPNDEWIAWEAGDADASLKGKRQAIESYIRTKSKQQKLEDTMSKLLWDWIIYGNCFAQITYVNETKLDPLTGELIPLYSGPKVMRVSPHDIRFNPTASDFKTAPKIIRYIKSLGELAKDSKTKPELGYTKEILEDIHKSRSAITSAGAKRISRADLDKSQGFVADGFGDIFEYYNSGLVEILEYYGDYYDPDTGELKENHVITVVDRRIIVREEPLSSWSGSSYIHSCPWRVRPDNLTGMGPLDNLVGMQYKINKLENLRADVFDQIAFPQKFIRGNVEIIGELGAPGTQYFADDADGLVQDIAPNPTALQADLQIRETIQQMEEMAGAPREAMGIRSPGEKTAFEVQTLDNAASRIFQNKIRWFESQFIEPILNDMLEISRRNLNGADLVRMQDSTFGIDQFLSVTKEDITATGKLTPKGSQHFSERAQTLQVLNGVLNGAGIQFLAPHLSRKRLGELLEELAGLEKFKLFQDNIGVMEDAETAKIQQAAQAQIEAEDITPTEEGDVNENIPNQ